MKVRTGTFSLAMVVAATLTTAAEAHTGATAPTGFAYGFVHPFGGIDHILTMFSVGVFAFLLGGSVIWLVPAAFVVAMAVGGTFGLSGMEIPFVEAGIALSVVATGLFVALGRKLPVALAMGLVGIFAIFHGHAHGAEMPAAATPLSYAAGMVFATVLLHATGLVGAHAVSRLLSAGAVRLAGAAVAAAGLALFGGAI
jgi:urease accessory protein